MVSQVVHEPRAKLFLVHEPIESADADRTKSPFTQGDGLELPFHDHQVLLGEECREVWNVRVHTAADCLGVFSVRLRSVEPEAPKGTSLDSHAIRDEETGKRLADKALGFFRRNRSNAKPLECGVRNTWTRRKRGIMAHGRSS